MSVLLATLADRLQRAVPPRDGLPDDYEELAREAVAQLSQDLPIMAAGSIQVVAGTASYSLPADFLALIAFGGASAVDGVVIGDNGIVPMGSGWRETHYVNGDTLTIDPTPTYTMTRTLRYAACHVLAGGAYPRLSENGARVALLYGQYLALSAQANAQAGDGWSYKIGDESVDKRGVGAAIQGQAQAALQAYNVAIRPLKGYGAQYKANRWAEVEV